MALPTVGFHFDTQGLESLVPSKAEMSVIGATLTAPAKASGIEYNRLYAINTDNVDFFTALGSEGTAQAAIAGVAKQLGPMQRSARMVVNIVPEGTTGDVAARLAATTAAIVGDPILKTGVHLFKKAGQQVNVIPRILIAPGYTSQRSGNLANAVCSELATICETLVAVAPVTGPSSSLQAGLDWRETLSSKRLIPTETDVIISGPDGNPLTVPSDAYIAGLINQVDELHGGMPFHVAGNRSVQGVLGPARYLEYSSTDGDTEGQVLLQNNMGIIIRGEGGDDFSIAEGGTIYLGAHTASNESLWQFYNQVRGRDWIHLTMLRTLRELLLRYNLTGRLVQVYVNTIRDILSRLAADELIHKDFQVQLVPALNTPADLRAGQLTVKMAVEEPSPFMRGVIKSERYEFALTNFIETLASQVNTVAL